MIYTLLFSAWKSKGFSKNILKAKIAKFLTYNFSKYLDRSTTRLKGFSPRSREVNERKLWNFRNLGFKSLRNFKNWKF